MLSQKTIRTGEFYWVGRGLRPAAIIMSVSFCNPLLPNLSGCSIGIPISPRSLVEVGRERRGVLEPL